jgi:uncharacterized protein (DUF2062 family)
VFKKIKTVIVEQIKMGATPEKLAQSVMTGVIIGIIPLLGTATVLAALTATKMKLNHVVTQTVHYLMYPVQLIMIPIYIKTVGLIFDVGDTPIRPDLIYAQFKESPSVFLMKYGLIGFYALFVWGFLSLVMYFIFYPIILKSINKFKGRRAKGNG